MEIFVTGLHITLCFFLILVVLLQPGKGADFGAAMGGSSQEAFGAAGSVTILTKLTAGAAALFMCTSLMLARFSSSGGESDISVDELIEQAGETNTEPEAEPSSSLGEATAPTEGEAAPAEGEAAPTEGEAAPAEGEAAPAEGEAAPAPE